MTGSILWLRHVHACLVGHTIACKVPCGTAMSPPCHVTKSWPPWPRQDQLQVPPRVGCVPNHVPQQWTDRGQQHSWQTTPRPVRPLEAECHTGPRCNLQSCDHDAASDILPWYSMISGCEAAQCTRLCKLKACWLEKQCSRGLGQSSARITFVREICTLAKGC